MKNRRDFMTTAGLALGAMVVPPDANQYLTRQYRAGWAL